MFRKDKRKKNCRFLQVYGTLLDTMGATGWEGQGPFLEGSKQKALLVLGHWRGVEWVDFRPIP